MPEYHLCYEAYDNNIHWNKPFEKVYSADLHSGGICFEFFEG
jgi:hypothetical protein